MSPQARKSYDSGYELLETVFVTNFDEITPEFVRKCAVMECLLFAFIEHAEDLSLLDKMEHELKDLVLGSRSTMNN